MLEKNQKLEAEQNTMIALFNVNKKAKYYAEMAHRSYSDGFKAATHWYSQRKKTLYWVKREAIKRLLVYDELSVDSIQMHGIPDEEGDKRLYYNVVFEDDHNETWSFHVRHDEISDRDIPNSITPQHEDYLSAGGDHPNVSDTKYRTTQCLKHLEACGLNANKYVKKESVVVDGEEKRVTWFALGNGGRTLDDCPFQVCPVGR